MNRNLKIATITFLITLLSSFEVYAQFLKLGDDPDTVLLFEHDDFSWGIKKVKIIKKTFWREKTVDSLYAFIEFESDKIKGNGAIKLDKSYHSLYTKMQYVKPVNPYAAHCFQNGIQTDPKHNEWSDYWRTYIKIVKTRSDTIYRTQNNYSYTIYLDPTKIDKTLLDRIANDLIAIKNKEYVIDNNLFLDKNMLLEAVALGFPPNKNLHNFKNDNGEFMHINEYANVVKGDLNSSTPSDISVNSFYSGTILEGQFIQSIGIYHIDLYAEYEKLWQPNYSTYINSNGSSIVELFDFDYIDKIDCTTNINVAVKNCLDIESIYLINPMHKDLPETIGQLTNLQKLGVNEVTTVKIPNNINLLNKLEILEFKKIGTLIFPKSFKGADKLRSITMEDCNLNSIPKVFFDLDNLQNLSVNGNTIKELPVELADIEPFYYLNIDYDPNMIIPQALIDKKNLTISFRTSNEKDTTEALKMIATLGKLKPEEHDYNLEYWNVTKSYD